MMAAPILSSDVLDIGISLQSEAWLATLPNAEEFTQEICAVILKKLGFTNRTSIELSVVLADDAFIQRLNAQYRHKDKPTNVLSFPAMEVTPDDLPSLIKSNEPIVLGDIIVALETLEREAQEQKKTFRDHFCHMLTHGMLHLLGYDHEMDAEAEQMEQLEVDILKQFGIIDPYLEK